MNRLLLALGIVFVSAGLAWPWLKRMHLFQLPGDILIDRPGFKFIFPITTMLIVSAAPDDNSLAGASQVLRRLSHRPDYQAYPAAVLPASICVNALAILAGST